jgi:signal transduction histidine kinase
MTTFLIKIVRELITNIIKHSQAKDVLIFLQTTKDNLMIIVQDDGIGFNADEVMAKNPNSFGFFSIREGLSHIGGFLNVRSEPGKGTKANIIVPLSLLNTD